MGTRGKSVTEVKVAWDVAMDLKQVLLKKGYRVVLTKTAELSKVTNQRRAEIANESHAALMLRLHCDASAGSGYAIYYPTRKGTVRGFTGPSTSMLKATAPVANSFYRGFEKCLSGKLVSHGLKSDTYTAIGGKQGALTGSIYSKVPTILIEMVVLTNPADEAFITSRQGHSAMVAALAAGVFASVRLHS
jgi:N-acetylmuramoyl-L-alanine amidase